MHANDGCLDPDDVAALLHARLAPESRRALEEHIAVCGECRELISALVQSDAPPTLATLGSRGKSRGDIGLAATLPWTEPYLDVSPGARVGRYVVETQLGAGAMGAVYVAHDPELDRKIALKILHHDGFVRGERELVQDQLRREAQAMAQLAHPNVVAVHDVGTVNDHIFIAMELVEGQTLADWLAAAPRSWRAVLAKFLPAGQGLAAAHAAGMVHRDFKPENVLVGHDGRVRVGDFGLARMLAPEPPHGGREPPRADRVDASGSTTGWLAGTPYYMAPEQFLCQAADARSDQFSFCVALYAAITGQHPFAGEDVEGLAEAVTEGRLRPPSDHAALPRRLLRILRRGLATDPADRYPSMDALLAELGQDPGRRRARAATVAVAVLVLTGGGVLIMTRSDPQLLCKGAERKWAGIWDPPRAQAIEQVFAATGKPYASAAYATVVRQLDAYRSGWSAMHTEACEATRVRGEQTESLLERRMLCLDARLRDARALIDSFAVADASTVERAPIAVDSLGDLAHCANALALSSQVWPPADQATSARVAELRSELAALKAQRATGRASEGRARIAALVSAAAATRYRPLESEVLAEQGAIENAAGDLIAAARAYEQAIWSAEAGRDDQLAAHAWTQLMLVRRAQAHYDQGLALTPRVTAVLERLGGDDELEGELRVARASILSATEHVEEAQVEADKARVLLERRFGADDLRVASALDELASVAYLSGRTDDAIDYYRRMLAIKRRAFGNAHPAVAAVLTDLAQAQALKSRYEDSVATLSEAQGIYERAVDANHPALATVAYSFGVSYEGLGQFDKAVAMHRRAVAIGAIAYRKDHPNYASYLMGLGYALEGLKHYDEALATLRQALPIMQKWLGPEHRRVATCLSHIAVVLMSQKHFKEARETIVGVIAIYEKSVSGEHVDLRQPLLILGTIEIKLGAPERAIAPLERAYALGSDTDPGIFAEIQWELGRALVDARRDAVRGMSLVRTAQQHFEHDERTSEDLRELLEWRRRRG